MKLGYKKITVAAVLLLALAAAGATWLYSREPDTAYRQATVARGDIEVAILVTGVVQPRNRLEIKPPIAGRVETLLVREGQAVQRGTILAWMSSTERAALLDAARARGPDELARWEELYRATPVIAPIAGTIILRNAEPGQTFQAQDAILVMSDRLVVKAQVDETDIGQVKLKQAARVTLDAYPDEALPARVGQIAFDSKTVNNVTTYVVDVLLEKMPATIRSGMTANVSFVKQAERNVLWVPTEAVAGRGKRATVLVPAADGAPGERPVEIGLSDGRRTEVRTGLAEGETILVPQLAKPGRAGASSNPLTPGAPRSRR